MSTDEWPFEAPPNVAVITLNRIVRDGQPILQVFHDEEDGGWQFLDGRAMTTSDAMIISLAEMLKHDPTVAQLADLPEGWEASRDSKLDPWKRVKTTPA